MFKYWLCSCPRDRAPSPQRRPPSSSPVVSSLSVEHPCSAAYSEPAAALPQRWPLRTRFRTCPPRPRRCILPGASRRAHGRQHCPAASDAAKDRRPVLPQGAAHYVGVRRPLPIRHWSGRVRSFCAPRRIALKGCYWCSNAGVSI